MSVDMAGGGGEEERQSRGPAEEGRSIVSKGGGGVALAGKTHRSGDGDNVTRQTDGMDGRENSETLSLQRSGDRFVGAGDG